MSSESKKTMETKSRNIHVALLPWLAFGHMMPLHELAISLAKAGVRVSYISTPNNIKRLPKPPPTLSPLINFVQFPLPTVDSNPLPKGAESTVDIPMEKIQHLIMAFDLLKKPFNDFVADQSPDWIIIDHFAHWAAEIAQQSHIPLMCFGGYSAAAHVYFGPPEYLSGDGRKVTRPTPESLTMRPKWVNFPSSVAFRLHEAIGVLAVFYGEVPSAKSAADRIAYSLRACQAVVVRSCRELEGEYLSLYADILGKPAIPLGLFAPKQLKLRSEVSNESWTRVFEWLDQQKPRSVMFVGFGSQTKLTKEQVYEIAYGLEASELPFLWALQKPSSAIDELDVLPPGFSHRTSQKGKVSIGWAPQLEILGHQSIGGFLFHSGWGSAIEALQFGHCLVLLPFILDQCLNARLLVDKGLAIEVERGQDGSFSRDDIAKSMKQAMVCKEREGIRARLGEVAVIVGDQKLQDRYIDEFVEYLKNGIAN